MALHRDTFNLQSFGPSLNATVKQSLVLMVGAGGIGCELLKNLALTGFGEIHIVDLDTIDLSNLNRQFLFRHEHIKKSKALVAKDVAERFNPNVRIEAHHANIKDAQFNLQWFQKFSIVFNALDNLEARRHVNRMCLAADIPLIESGTTGFNGQVQVIKKGVTACYDCTAKDVPKSFPVCTIRSTPSQPIHCIVWGKSYLLNEIFGTSEDQAVLDTSENEGNAEEIAELKKESHALRAIRNAAGTPDFQKMLFDKVFQQDISRLQSMEDMWKSRTPPTPLEYGTVMKQVTEAGISKDSVLEDGQKIWSLEENLVVFNDSADRLSTRLSDLKQLHGKDSPQASISFDKDDEDTLDFVAASANIRSYIFGIERKSRFDIKQMAGNIIPAIATTNAIVAGLCVLESFKVLRGEYDKAQEVFLSPFAPQRLLATDRPREPNPNCPICSNYQTSIYVDLSRATLNDLVEDFVKLQLGFGEREFAVNSDKGLLYDPDETDNLEKLLSELGLNQNSFVTIVDEEEEDTMINVVLNIQEATLEAPKKPIKVPGPDKTPDIPRKPRPEPAVESNGVEQANGKTDDLVAKSVTQVDDGVSKSDLKRRRDDDEAGVTLVKRTKRDDDVVVVADDAGTGAIVIDDD
ncbi:hypothetical protein F5Y18DRAFT_370456 [Xylariaceae sp. FL1019]|nr:hypothetical protein F5Y18DRAFT_370456 [Xylariaceae sp. FL1019]